MVLSTKEPRIIQDASDLRSKVRVLTTHQAWLKSGNYQQLCTALSAGNDAYELAKKLAKKICAVPVANLSLLVTTSLGIVRTAPVLEAQTPCNHQASLGVSYASSSCRLQPCQAPAALGMWLLAHAGRWEHLYLIWTNRSIRLKLCTRFGQCYPSISSLGLSFPVLLYTLVCQSRCCSAMFCTWLVERSVFSLSSFHVTFRSLPS